jgi:hypothetical protein
MRTYKSVGALLLITAAGAILFFNSGTMRFYTIESPYVAVIGCLSMAFGIYIGMLREPEPNVMLLGVPVKTSEKKE